MSALKRGPLVGGQGINSANVLSSRPIAPRFSCALATRVGRKSKAVRPAVSSPPRLVLLSPRAVLLLTKKPINAAERTATIPICHEFGLQFSNCPTPLVT